MADVQTQAINKTSVLEELEKMLDNFDNIYESLKQNMVGQITNGLKSERKVHLDRFFEGIDK